MTTTIKSLQMSPDGRYQVVGNVDSTENVHADIDLATYQSHFENDVPKDTLTAYLTDALEEKARSATEGGTKGAS